MKNDLTDFKLRERVKELNCLYALSKIAMEEAHDLNAILSKTLTILPQAMQFSRQAEVCIVVHKKTYATSGFDKTEKSLSALLGIGRQKYGSLKIAYRLGQKASRVRQLFLPEERNLIRLVARELSLYINRATIEKDKEKLQIQLQHAERLSFVGELSAGIAHELNEPLGKILGFAQLIKKTGALNIQQQEDIERIEKASLYTREIVKKLMIFSRQMPQQITSLNLNAIISNILYFIDVRFQSQGIKILQRLDANLPAIQADAVQMSQVLVNLITNAIHALPEGGEVMIITQHKANSVSLTVKDTGTGIHPSIKQRIFEPFFTTKDPGQGTGLGLSVVQGIIDSHRGNIQVSSVLGKGSKFVIRLPIKHRRS